MKKSDVDRARAESLAMLTDAGITLGPGEEIEITDFGKGEYDKLGLGLIIRLNEPEYASKWLTVAPGQVCPNHYHKIIKETFLIIFGPQFSRAYTATAGEDYTGKDPGSDPNRSMSRFSMSGGSSPKR